LKRHRVPRVIGSGSPFTDDSNSAVTSELRRRKDELLSIYRELGLPMPMPPGRPQKPMQDTPAPTPAADTTQTDPVRAEAALVASRLAANPDDIVAQRRATELLNLLEKNQ